MITASPALPARHHHQRRRHQRGEAQMCTAPYYHIHEASISESMSRSGDETRGASAKRAKNLEGCQCQGPVAGDNETSSHSREAYRARPGVFWNNINGTRNVLNTVEIGERSANLPARAPHTKRTWSRCRCNWYVDINRCDRYGKFPIVVQGSKYF